MAERILTDERSDILYGEYQVIMEHIKERFGVKTLHFNTCNRHPNTYVSWTPRKWEGGNDLLCIRINIKTFEIVQRMFSERKLALLDYRVINPGKAQFISNGPNAGTSYEVVYITEDGIPTPYDDPDTYEPAEVGDVPSCAQYDSRNDYSSYMGDFGGLEGEEAELAYWNCD